MPVKRRGKKGLYSTDFPGPKGKRIRISTGIADKKQAQEYEDKLKNDLWRQTRLGEKPNYTFGDAIVRYFKEIQKSKSEIEGDRYKLRYWYKSLGDISLKSLTRDHVMYVLNEMKITHMQWNEQKTEKIMITSGDKKNATKNRYLAVLRHLLLLARDEWKWIDTIPLIPAKKEPKLRIRWITHKEATRLLKELPDHLSIMAEFSLCTGLRQRNVLQLCWKQINFFNRTLSYEAADTKGGKTLAVPLPNRAIEILKKQNKNHEQFVFTYKGNPLAEIQHRTWKNACKRAEIENFKWHDLRHTWATWHVQKGTPLPVLKELGGWSNYEMVLKYAHFSAEHLLAAVKDFDINFEKVDTIMSQLIVTNNRKGHK